MTDLANGVNGYHSHGSKNVQDILETLNQIDSPSFANDGDRIQAVVAAYALVARLETPWEFVLRTCMGQVRNPSHSIPLFGLLCEIKGLI